MAPPDAKRIEDVLAHSILLAERLHSAAESFRSECAHLRTLLGRLWPLLHSLARFAAAAPSLYDLPIRRVLSDASKNLDRALTLARKCRREGVIRRLFSITSAADFRKVLRLLEASVANLTWLLRVYGAEGGGIELSLPPIAASDPILSWIWSFTASIHTRKIPDRTEAAIQLAAIAEVSDRNKKLIAEEGGVPALLKLLKDSDTEARTAAIAALHILADNQERVQQIVNSHGLPIIVQALRDGTMKVQVPAAMLVARMAEQDPAAQEGFASENAVESLVNLLSQEIKNRSAVTASARAIWMLARGSTASCWRITEKNGLLCLGKMVELETGELQYYSLMALMEVTAAAEVNVDLRKSAFKTNSIPVVDQLLRLINGDYGPDLKIPAIRSIGSLSLTFPARETRIIVSLMWQLGANADVATEAAISLGKFVCPQNFLRIEHSKTILELNGVSKVMRLLRGDETTQFYGLVLLCYLALHGGPGKARVLTALEGADRSVAAHHPELMQLVLKARYHLKTFEHCYGFQVL